jgi:hypothetical protein
LFGSSGRRFGIRYFFFDLGCASARVWGQLADVQLDFRKLTLPICLEHTILGKRSEFLLDSLVVKPGEFISERLEFTCGDCTGPCPVGFGDQGDSRVQLSPGGIDIGPSRGHIAGELSDLDAEFLLLREKLPLGFFRSATRIVGLASSVA